MWISYDVDVLLTTYDNGIPVAMKGHFVWEDSYKMAFNIDILKVDLQT